MTGRGIHRSHFVKEQFKRAAKYTASRDTFTRSVNGGSPVSSCGGGLPKKITGLASGQRASCAEKAHVVLELRQGHALTLLLKAAYLSRSTFYYQVKAQQVEDRHAGLKARIRAVYECHKGRYGYRRITASLRQSGEAVNHKTVQRLMQVLGLKSLVRPKKYRSYRDQQTQTGAGQALLRGNAALTLRSRLAVSNGGVPAPVGSVRANPEHVMQGKLPRQCSHGKLLRHAEVRVLLSGALRKYRAASDRHSPVHPLLQSLPHQNKTKRPV